MLLDWMLMNFRSWPAKYVCQKMWHSSILLNYYSYFSIFLLKRERWLVPKLIAIMWSFGKKLSFYKFMKINEILCIIEKMITSICIFIYIQAIDFITFCPFYSSAFILEFRRIMALWSWKTTLNIISFFSLAACCSDVSSRQARKTFDLKLQVLGSRLTIA